jgi:hypothetical protein
LEQWRRRRERFGDLLCEICFRTAVIEAEEIGPFDDPARFHGPGDRAAEAQHTAWIHHRRIAAKRFGQRDVLTAAGGWIVDGIFQAPYHLRAQMRMAAGDDNACRRTAAVAVFGRRGRHDIVVEIDIERGQRKEIFVLAAAEGRRVGLAQRLADIDVLPRSAILGDSAVDQFIQSIDSKDGRVAQPSISPIGPGKLDASPSQPSSGLKQMRHVALHVLAVWRDDRLEVRHGHSGHEGRL